MTKRIGVIALAALTISPSGGAVLAAESATVTHALAFSRQSCETGLPANNGCGHDIFTSIDGEVTAIRATPAFNEVEPSFSGDGSRLAFSAWDADVIASHVWVANADGTMAYPLTRGDTVWDDTPDWSPTANEVVFSRTELKKPPGPNDRGANLLANSDLWVVAEVAPGVWAERLLVRQKGTEGSPDFSPDGTRIAYAQDYDDDDNQQRSDWKASEIWTINADGTDPVRLTHSPLHETQPAWSPDGSFIAFSRGFGGNPVRDETARHLWIMKSDGSGARRLTRGAVVDGSPAWSEDGRSIVFQRCPILEPGAWPWPDCVILEVDLAKSAQLSTVVDQPGAFDGDPEIVPVR